MFTTTPVGPLGWLLFLAWVLAAGAAWAFGNALGGWLWAGATTRDPARPTSRLVLAVLLALIALALIVVFLIGHRIG